MACRLTITERVEIGDDFFRLGRNAMKTAAAAAAAFNGTHSRRQPICRQMFSG